MSDKLNSMSFPSAYYTGSGCVGCGGCFYTCPEPGAVTVFEEEVEK
jgi:NAD-dependent dihydropyrimidine dehydrogenase PreA subunit